MKAPSPRLLQFLGSKVAPPRFIAFLVVLAALLAGLRLAGCQWTHAFIYSFDGAALFFLALCAPLLRDSDARSLRRHAAANDANRPILLVVTGVTMFAILAALIYILPHAASARAKLVIVATLGIAWLFSNTVYALHYAHLYYRKSTARAGWAFRARRRPIMAISSISPSPWA